MLTAITWMNYVRNFMQIRQEAQKVCVDIHTSPASKFSSEINEIPIKYFVAANM